MADMVVCASCKDEQSMFQKAGEREIKSHLLAGKFPAIEMFVTS
jgi:hypothetical protein